MHVASKNELRQKSGQRIQGCIPATFFFWFFYDTSWDQSHSRWWHHLSLSNYHLRRCYNSIVAVSEHLAGIKETSPVRFRLVDRSGSSRTVAGLAQPTALRSVLAEQLLLHSNFPWRPLHVYWTWQPMPLSHLCPAALPVSRGTWMIDMSGSLLANSQVLLFSGLIPVVQWCLIWQAASEPCACLHDMDEKWQHLLFLPPF